MMYEGFELAAGVWAFQGLQAVQMWILFGLRVLLSLFGALLGWYLVRPLASLLFRLAFHRPLPPRAQTVTRLVGAVAVGMLVFYLFPLGLGSGDGPGPGGGPGLGPGAGGPVKPTPDPTAKNGKPPDDKGPRGTTPLRVEMVLSERYGKDDRWYLIDGKGPPLNLKEVDAFLTEQKGKFAAVHILVYANSVHREHEAVDRLKALANSTHRLPVLVPEEYHKRTKADPK